MIISTKNKIVSVISLMAVFFIASTVFASANTVVRTGETVSITGDQVVDGDLYVAAGKVNISGNLSEDVMILGGQVKLNGNVAENAFMIAGSVDVNGQIGDDLRIIAAEVTIADSISGDLFVMGGSVNILSSASVAGDVLIYAGDVVIEGFVGGDVIGLAGNLRIDSDVVGNVNVTVNKLTLGDRANIGGSVSYISSQLVNRSLNATVAGELVRNDPVIPKTESNRFAWLAPSLILLFSVLTWYLVSRKTLNAVVSRSLVMSPRPLVTGALTFFLAPIAIGLLLVSLIGSVVGFVLLLAYFKLIFLSFIGMVAVLGQLLMISFNRQSGKKVILLSLIVGLFGFLLLTMLPVLGYILIAVLMLTTLGAIVDLLVRPNPEK